MKKSTQQALMIYAGYCAGMTLASRVLPALPDSLVSLFNLAQRLNVLLYLPNSPALLAVSSSSTATVANANDVTLPEVTVTG